MIRSFLDHSLTYAFDFSGSENTQPSLFGNIPKDTLASNKANVAGESNGLAKPFSFGSSSNLFTFSSAPAASRLPAASQASMAIKPPDPQSSAKPASSLFAGQSQTTSQAQGSAYFTSLSQQSSQPKANSLAASIMNVTTSSNVLSFSSPAQNADPKSTAQSKPFEEKKASGGMILSFPASPFHYHLIYYLSTGASTVSFFCLRFSPPLGVAQFDYKPRSVAGLESITRNFKLSFAQPFYRFFCSSCYNCSVSVLFC